MPYTAGHTKFFGNEDNSWHNDELPELVAVYNENQHVGDVKQMSEEKNLQKKHARLCFFLASR